MDVLHKITNWVDHNRYKALAIIITVAVLVIAIGCESQTASIVTPERTVTRDQLAVESVTVQADLAFRKAEIDKLVAMYNADIEKTNQLIDQAVADLDRQDEIRAELFELGGSVITGWAAGGVPTEALIGTGLTAFSILFGIGSAADGMRKDKVIAAKSEPAKPPA